MAGIKLVEKINSLKNSQKLLSKKSYNAEQIAAISTVEIDNEYDKGFLESAMEGIDALFEEIYNVSWELNDDLAAIESPTDFFDVILKVIGSSFLMNVNHFEAALEFLEHISDGIIGLIYNHSFAISNPAFFPLELLFGIEDPAHLINSNVTNSIASLFGVDFDIDNIYEEFVGTEAFNEIFDLFWDSCIDESDSYFKHDGTVGNFQKSAFDIIGNISLDLLGPLGIILSVASTYGITSENAIINGKNLDDANTSALRMAYVDLLMSLIPECWTSIKRVAKNLPDMYAGMLDSACSIFDDIHLPSFGNKTDDIVAATSNNSNWLEPRPLNLENYFSSNSISAYRNRYSIGVEVITPNGTMAGIEADGGAIHSGALYELINNTDLFNGNPNLVNIMDDLLNTGNFGAASKNLDSVIYRILGNPENGFTVIEYAPNYLSPYQKQQRISLFNEIYRISSNVLSGSKPITVASTLFSDEYVISVDFIRMLLQGLI